MVLPAERVSGAAVCSDGGVRTDGDLPTTVAATFCATVVDEWVRAGVRHAVIAPGSRSTPMAVALAERPDLEVHVHPDERAAAFVALGIGLSSGRPAVVLTTSGTAAVELHPAVVEAHHACVPLIAVTADRPPELQGVGAPQTVDQRALFGSSTARFVEPGVPDQAARDGWRSLASRTVADAVGGSGPPGPVHLNLAFREPLLGRAGPLPDGRDGGAPWHAVGSHRRALDRTGTEQLRDLLDQPRGLIVAGARCGPPDAVFALVGVTGWPVLADPRSGLRGGHPGVVTAGDAILRHGPTAAALRPDVVLRLGEAPASKVLARWLADCGATQVAVDAWGRHLDPERTASLVLHADPGAVCTALSRLIGDGGTEGWTDGWRAAEAAADAAISATVEGQVTVTGPVVARAVTSMLTARADREPTLVVSSSMPVRDLEWYGGSHPGVRVLSNRGANGIDGVVSTAVGVALQARGSGSPTVALVGDLALLHDTNALLGMVARHVDLTIVVVDNDGGEIFSFLPPAAGLPGDRFEQLFGTPHGVDLTGLARAHGVAVREPVSPAELATGLAAAVDAPGASVVRVRTDRSTSVAHHDDLHRAVADALASTSP